MIDEIERCDDNDQNDDPHNDSSPSVMHPAPSCLFQISITPPRLHVHVHVQDGVSSPDVVKHDLYHIHAREVALKFPDEGTVLCAAAGPYIAGGIELIPVGVLDHQVVRVDDVFLSRLDHQWMGGHVQDDRRMVQPCAPVDGEDSEICESHGTAGIGAGHDGIVGPLEFRHPANEPAARLDDLLDPGAVLLVGKTVDGQVPHQSLHVGSEACVDGESGYMGGGGDR